MSHPHPKPSRFSFGRFFFQQNTFARLALLALLVTGVVSYGGMIKETTPDLEIGVGIVVTPWLGSDPQTIEQEVTNKIEKELKSLQGLKRMQSSSFSGVSLIVAEFQPNVPQAEAMSRLRAKVATVEGELPREAKKPIVSEISVNDSPIFSVRLFGNVDLEVIGAVARELERALERTPGVNKVGTSGDRREAILIRLLGARMAALGVSPSTVRAALEEANVDVPWGEFEGERVGSSFRLLGRFRDLEDLRSLPVASTASGRTILLRELAEVERGLEKEVSRTFFASAGEDFRPSVDITLTKRPGADAIKTIASVKDVISRQQLSSSWPSGLEYVVVVDESIYIKNDLKSVFDNGWQAMLAVFVILMISLTWREALVAGLAIPVAFAGGLSALAAIGYSLNTLVIIGMVLALGLLVDDFILMMEGMHEHIYMQGQTFGAAALATVRTYALPSLSGSLTTILAMAPLLSIAGIEGKFIRQMPMATIACLVASYLVSVFLAIPLSRWVLGCAAKSGEGVEKTRVDRLTEIYSEKLVGLLQARFVRSRGSSWAWTGATVALFLLSSLLFATLPTEMMPKGDGEFLGITIELPPDTSLENAQVCADAVGETLLGRPYLRHITKHVGAKSPFSLASTVDELSPVEGSYLVGFSAIFTPKKSRDAMLYEYVPEIRADLEKIMGACPGGRMLFTPDLGGASAEDPIQIEIIGKDISTLRALADSVASALSEIPGASDVRNNLGAAKSEIRAYPRREAMSFYGLSAASIGDQIRTMMASDEVGKFVLGGTQEDLRILMGYAWPSRNGQLGGPTSIEEMYLLNVISEDGQGIPLPSVVDLEIGEASLSILHKDGERAVMVLAKTEGRTAGEILADLKPRLEELTQGWPVGFRYEFAGEAESSEEVFGSARRMLILALFLVFALLVLQFDSFKQPFIIMSAIPLALIGTFLGFFILQKPFSFMAMVGVIALIGIVVNDTIIMIETMNTHLAGGMAVFEAAARGAADRLRPIVTTSVTTIVGLIPLAISQKMYLPLSITVISGLIFSTFLALLIVPCLYVLFTGGQGSGTRENTTSALAVEAIEVPDEQK